MKIVRLAIEAADPENRGQNSKKNNYNQKKIDRHVSYIDKKLEEYNQVLAEQDGDNKQLIQHEIEKHQGRKKKY